MVHVGKGASSVKKFCRVESLSSLRTAGELMPTNKYSDFLQAISRKIPVENIITDPLKRVAIGANASFYRLVPQAIVNVENEKEVRIILQEARKRRLPVTFRAAGTSLSGQSVTDSILYLVNEVTQPNNITT